MLSSQENDLENISSNREKNSLTRNPKQYIKNPSVINKEFSTLQEKHKSSEDNLLNINDDNVSI